MVGFDRRAKMSDYEALQRSMVAKEAVSNHTKDLRTQLAAANKRIEELEKGVAQVWLTRTFDNIHLWTEPQEWDDEYDEFSGDTENCMYLGEFDVPGLAHQQCRSARIVLAPENRSTK